MPFLPTSRRDLIADSSSAHATDGALRSGRTVAPYHGIHVDAAHAAGLLARICAALATQAADAVVGMQTAAAMHALRWLPPAWSDPASQIQVVVTQGDAHRHRKGLRLHRRLLRPEDVTMVQGVACLSVTRTLIELARDPAIAPRLIVQIIDGALQERRTSIEELQAALAAFPGERYIARARRIVERCRAGVRSPQETTVRLVLADADIELDVPIVIRDEDGDPLAEGDFGISRLLLWGEYDGFDPHSQRNVFRSDRRGDRWLTRRGWQPMRFVDTDLRTPERLVAEWRQAIADAPARIAALDPRRSPEVAAAHRAMGLSPAA